MIIETKHDKYKHIRCIVTFDDDTPCISSYDTYVEICEHESKEHLLPYISHYQPRVCFGVRGVSSERLRKSIGVPCVFYMYIEEKPYMKIQCRLAKFKKELSGFNEGGYRLEFQIDEW